MRILRRVDHGVDKCEIQAPAIRDRLPVAQRGAAEGVDPDANAAVADGVEIEDGAQILDVGADQIPRLH